MMIKITNTIQELQSLLPRFYKKISQFFGKDDPRQFSFIHLTLRLKFLLLYYSSGGYHFSPCKYCDSTMHARLDSCGTKRGTQKRNAP